MSRQVTPAPQTPRPRAHAAAPRGIKFPISKSVFLSLRAIKIPIGYQYAGTGI